jgi:iron-sulfur cluster repair protein YtfE (RIC family)
METQTTFETVTHYLSWDHDRLDAILADVALKVDAGKMGEARDTYRGFDHGLRRHIRIEEELLFPLFEARTGVVSGPTAVMRSEHREIERAIGLMREALGRGDADGFREGLRFLRAVLPDHNAKEEHVLYPTTDRLLSPAELASFVARLTAE